LYNFKKKTTLVVSTGGMTITVSDEKVKFYNSRISLYIFRATKQERSAK